jgi:hypothetical protein
MLGGLQGRSGLVRKISPLPGFDPRIVQPVASRYTNWTVPARKCIIIIIIIIIIISGTAAQRGLWPPRHTKFLDHTQRRATVCRALLDEWSVRRRDLYLTTHTTDKISMPPVGFEHTIAACEGSRVLRNLNKLITDPQRHIPDSVLQIRFACSRRKCVWSSRLEFPSCVLRCLPRPATTLLSLSTPNLFLFDVSTPPFSSPLSPLLRRTFLSLPSLPFKKLLVLFNLS